MKGTRERKRAERQISVRLGDVPDFLLLLAPTVTLTFINLACRIGSIGRNYIHVTLTDYVIVVGVPFKSDNINPKIKKCLLLIMGAHHCDVAIGGSLVTTCNPPPPLPPD